MSTTSEKRSNLVAQMDAFEFRDLFAGCYERWEIAGSVRRKKPLVGDVEHVVIPKIEMRENPESLFFEECETNLMLTRSDELVRTGKLQKHLYPNNQNRWGEKYRGLDFRGFAHELFFADKLNWGSVLSIRTGPADFSEMLVTRIYLSASGLRQKDGYVRYPDGSIFETPTEECFFKACGVPFCAPCNRIL